MTRAAAPPILLQLHSSESVCTQVASLRALKNELIGHDQRKESYVAGGIIPTLAQVLALRGPGKAADAGANGSALGQATTYQHSDDSKACLQAILVVGSLAQGKYSEKIGSVYLKLTIKQVAQHSLPQYSPATSFLRYSQFSLPRIAHLHFLSRSYGFSTPLQTDCPCKVKSIGLETRA